ncbi:hypothetical protein [Streptomyces sp. NPDC020983]|uniref:hypothetical protein n=1 Tax=Streptomyces sp. NPDC020983 TaxID=3365106 RepID=UPI0037A20AF5
MDASTVTAVAATAIASASFAVSISEARTTRRHNRHSVAPLLEIWTQRRQGGTTGLRLCNYGLGPAVVTSTSVALDGVELGGWIRPVIDGLRGSLAEWPRALAVNPGHHVIPAGAERFLMHVPDYDPVRHGDLWQLLTTRLTLRVTYDSLYGGEGFEVRHPLPYT